MKKFLLIAWYFPPDGGAGTQRVIKLCKYMQAFSWKPIVLTSSVQVNRSEVNPEDKTLLNDVGKNISIIRVNSPLNGEITHEWIEVAFYKANKIIEENDIKLVMITMSPFELSHIGHKIQSKIKIPVIYDLRDPWALDGWPCKPSKRVWKEEFQLMKNTLLSADGVVANTNQSKNELLKNINGLNESCVCVIPNGYDNDDFNSISVNRNNNNKFFLVHTGFLQSYSLFEYKGIIGRIKKLRHYRPEPIIPSGRTPYYLFKAIEILNKEQHPITSILNIIFVGIDDKYTRLCVNEMIMNDYVTFTGYLQHFATIEWLMKADALFLPLHGLPNGYKSLIVPGKVYEYIASKKPILACLPEGDAKDIIKESGLGVFADPCDPKDIASAIRELYDKWIVGFYKNIAIPVSLKRFDRKNIASRLAEFFNKVLNKI